MFGVVESRAAGPGDDVGDTRGFTLVGVGFVEGPMPVDFAFLGSGAGGGEGHGEGTLVVVDVAAEDDVDAVLFKDRR